MDMNTMINAIIDTDINGLMDEECLMHSCWKDTLPFALMSPDERIIINEPSILADVIENLEANMDMNVSDILLERIRQRVLERGYVRMRRLRRERLMKN